MGWGMYRRTAVAAGLIILPILLILAGCAGGGSTSSLKSAERSCEAATRNMGDIARCDRFVDAATAAGDQAEIAKAYLFRSFMHEFRDDLPGALADTDRAIAAWPDFTTSKRRRAQLLAESGDYAGARDAFARLEGVDEDPAFDEALALIEYVDGDRAKVAPLFRSAAISYLEEDDNPWMSAFLNFEAAIVESELRNGDLAPIAATAELVKQDKMLTLLWRHRMREISDGELLQAVEAMPKSPFGPWTCWTYFSIGHRSVVEGARDAAVEGFRRTLEDCRQSEFEHHAARTWLKQLGG